MCTGSPPQVGGSTPPDRHHVNIAERRDDRLIDRRPPRHGRVRRGGALHLRPPRVAPQPPGVRPGQQARGRREAQDSHRAHAPIGKGPRRALDQDGPPRRRPAPTYAPPLPPPRTPHPLTTPPVSKHRDLLTPPPDTTPTAPLTADEKATVVVDRAPQFATTASQLKALEDQQIPSTDGFTRLAQLLPRIAEAEDAHLQQALKISELRKRSGLLVQRVKQVQFLGAARCWTEWQGRLLEVQKDVGRREFRVRQEKEDQEEEGV